MKNNSNFLNLATYFEEKMDLQNLSIDDLQYDRNFSLFTLFKSHLYDVLDGNFFGFQVKDNQPKGFFKRLFWKKKITNNQKNIY